MMLDNAPIEHDRLFKELLTTFFREFIALFFPQVAQFLDPEFAVVPMKQEIYNDIASGERHVVDLLMRGKFKGQGAFFLIHVENQATAQADFPRRMFDYFARLTHEYRLPVYPIVVFSYDAPKRAEPNRYMVTFPNKTVLRFDYDVVQLNRIPWRRFLKSNNPVATALMTKMKIAPRDRPKARAELLRVLATQRLDPAYTKLIGLFIDGYLKMTADEMRKFERVLAGFDPTERETTVEMMTSWELKGLEQGLERGLEQGLERGLEQGLERGLEQGLERGLHTGKEDVILRLLRKRFGTIPNEMNARIDRLSSEQLSDLSEDLLDFTSLHDLEEWLLRR